MARTKKWKAAKKAREEPMASDSRTSAVGQKRAAASVQEPSSKRQKCTNQTSTKQKQASTVGLDNSSDLVPFSSLQDSDSASGQATASKTNFGKNRLSSGFLASRRVQRSASHPGTPEDSDDSISQTNEPTTIDLDTTDEDGGITLNVRNGGPIVISDDESESEDGEINEDGDSEDDRARERDIATVQDEQMQLDVPPDHLAQEAAEVPSVLDSVPGIPQVYLKDLNPNQLDAQIKYAFWQLRRDQIDLGRIARCLHCQLEGHIDENCPDKTCTHCGVTGEHDSLLCPKARRCDTCRQPGHSNCKGMKNTTIPCDICALPGHAESACASRHYQGRKLATSDRIELWITCCSCGSKSHLVGDCPQLRSTTAGRWSLKSLDPRQVVNLSIQKDIEKLEKEAQNRGMRPQGLQIKGRAGTYTANDARRHHGGDSSDELENFLSHPPARREHARQFPAINGSSYRPAGGVGYDRYAAPNGPDSYRPPRSAFYATDSFGRPRSRSPPRQGSHAARRSPSPAYNSYTPRGIRLSPPPQRANLPPKPNAFTPKPGPGVKIQLPTRKGSNISLPAAATTKLPAKPPSMVDRSNWTKSQKQHNGLTKAERRAKKKK